MIAHKLTLVLGAGASCPYGFPTGSQLREQIIQFEPQPFYAPQFSAEFRAFQQAFRDSHCTSIDTFLAEASNKRHELSGKRAIAHALLPCEHKSVSFFSKDGDWYQIFADALLAPPGKDQKPPIVDIVTFNYDRSLEAFLLKATQNRFGLNAEDSKAKVDSLVDINHVYGWLGPLPVHWSSKVRSFPDSVRYGDPTDADDAAKNIDIIRDREGNSASFVRARASLARLRWSCSSDSDFSQRMLKNFNLLD